MIDKTRIQFNLIKREMQKYIRDNELQQGDRCGSELYFSNKFSVNRRTVRMVIEELCHQNILEKKKNSGIFVKDAHSIKPEISFNLIFPGLSEHKVVSYNEIQFALDDYASPGWSEIFALFEKNYPPYRVAPHYLCPYKNLDYRLPDCDLYFATFDVANFRHINFSRRYAFSEKFLLERKISPAFNTALQENLLNNVKLKNDKLKMIPLGALFPFRLFNLEYIKKFKLPHPNESLEQIKPLWKYCEKLKKQNQLHKFFPFIQNPLNHYFRLNSNVFKSPALRLNTPELIELLELQKEFFSDFFIRRPDLMFPEILKLLPDGDFLAIEIFSNAVSFCRDIPVKPQSLMVLNNSYSEQGESQQLFRYIWAGDRERISQGTKMLAEFLTSEPAARLFARHKIMLPYFGTSNEVELLARHTPLSADFIWQETRKSTACFQNKFLQDNYEVKVFNPKFRNFCRNQITLDEMIAP